MQARAMGQAAMKDFEAQRWQSALDGFMAADQTMYSPVFRLYIARCHEHLGQVSEARAALRAIVESTMPNNAPTPWHQAREEARRELAALDEEAAGASTVNTAVTAPTSQSAAGATHSPASASPNTGEPSDSVGGSTTTAARPTSAAPTAATVRAPGGASAQAGARHSSANLGAATSSSSQPATLTPTSADSSATYRSMAYGTLGVGILGLCVGAVTGVAAWSVRDKLRDDCGGYACPDEDSYRRRIDEGKTFGNVATIAFATAAVSLAASGVLFYVTPSATVTPGSGGLGLAGRF